MGRLEEIKAKLSPEGREAVEAVEANAERVLLHFITDAAWLGAKSEWDMDDNFNTTEGIAELATDLTGLTTEEWREIAHAVGYSDDDLGIEPDDDEDEDELGDEEEWDS